MEYQDKFLINDKIYLRDPENSELGKMMIKKAIELIADIGFENFTFKKLAVEINSTEASIYRYFENKHRILLYILNWYWSYMEFLVNIKLENIVDNREKLKTILHLLTDEFEENQSEFEYNMFKLNRIIIAESSKVYLVKEVVEINKEEVFKPYKNLSARIAEVISEYNSEYLFPRSLSTTLIEASHHQQYFSNYLPNLTDAANHKTDNFTYKYLENLLFSVLGDKKNAS